MKKLILLALLSSFSLVSCLENENSIVSTSTIDLFAGILPDTVIVNSTTPISLRATAPNSCWHSIRFRKETIRDTLTNFWAIGTFENHGEVCNDVLVTKDTVINLIPTATKSYIFQFLENYNKVRVDTIVVVAE
ncbi:MAG: hypothetical protein F9K37_09430 [Bacteroidales bacterium]|nr:MAG: hypothetical protein F9K37_09430 [Bacteroidales bacterium]